MREPSDGDVADMVDLAGLLAALGVAAGDPLLDQLGREFERVRAAERRAIVAELRRLAGDYQGQPASGLALRRAADRIERGGDGS